MKKQKLHIREVFCFYQLKKRKSVSCLWDDEFLLNVKLLIYLFWQYFGKKFNTTEKIHQSVINETDDRHQRGIIQCFPKSNLSNITTGEHQIHGKIFCKTLKTLKLVWIELTFRFSHPCKIQKKENNRSSRYHWRRSYKYDVK